MSGTDVETTPVAADAATRAAEWELPKPDSIKDAEKVVERTFKEHRNRIEAARKAVRQAEKSYDNAIKDAKRELEKAGRPAKIASIGIVRQVTLNETTIKTPKGEFPLTPDVEARAEQHGNKQVVQGWVFKSDNDRREIYLHLTGPDWADVVPFPMKHASMQPRDLHEFAAKVGVAARNSDRSRATLAERARIADARLASAVADRAEVDAAAEAFVAAAWDVRELRPATKHLEAFLAEADASDRRVRKTATMLDDVRMKVKEFLGEAEATRNRIHQASAALPVPDPLPTPQAEFTASTNVTLLDAGRKQIQVIKVIRDHTQVSLGDAKGLVDRVPSLIVGHATPGVATSLKVALEGAGASVLLEPSTPSQAEPVSQLDPEKANESLGHEPATAGSSEPGDSGPDVFDQIRKLGELLDAGLITPDEFEAKKTELLARL